MATYQHILVALDLSDESEAILSKAHDIALLHQAKLSACHVVEPLAFAYGGDVPIDMSEAQRIIEEQAKIRIGKLLAKHPSTDITSYIQIGPTTSAIHDLAKLQQADLIVVGSHGRHGLALLFGSTANGVLHGACTDVLAVRV